MTIRSEQPELEPTQFDQMDQLGRAAMTNIPREAGASLESDPSSLQSASQTPKPSRIKLLSVVIAAALVAVCVFAVGCLSGGASSASHDGASGDDAAATQTASIPGATNSPDAAASSPESSEEEAAYEPGFVLVMLAEGATQQDLQAALESDNRLQGVAIQEVATDYAKLSLPDGLEVEQAVELLQASDLVSAAQPNYTYKTVGVTSDSSATATSAASSPFSVLSTTVASPPSDLSVALVPDGFFETQSEDHLYEQWGLDAAKVRNAWSTLAGETTAAALANPVTIAIIDQGFMVSHEDLDPHLLADTYDAADSTSAAPDKNVSGDNSHGTHVMGIIAATSENAAGISGVTPNNIGIDGVTNNWCKVLPIKVAHNDGKGMTSETVAKAYDYLFNGAAAQHNVKVINISLGRNSHTDYSGEDDLIKTRITRARERGIVTVVAASNEDSDFPTAPFYSLPADYTDAITVMNVRQDTNSDGVTLAESSNYNTPYQTAKNICAPGDVIWSFSSSGPSSYTRKDGTSMAAPYVAGIIGLVCTAHQSAASDPGAAGDQGGTSGEGSSSSQSITPTQIENVLYSTTKDLTQTPGSRVGWDSITGYGLVNAEAAVEKTLHGNIDEPSTMKPYALSPSPDLPKPKDPPVVIKPDPEPEPDPTPTPQTIPMYRLYNKWTGEHFFTSSASEYRGLVKKGWNDEKIGWYAPTSGDPVYRLYNKWSGEHHFTTSASEYANCLRVGWIGEGVAFYSGGSQAVYRLYNPYERSFYHHYTTSSREYRDCIKAGWRDEHIGWYGH